MGAVMDRLQLPAEHVWLTASSGWSDGNRPATGLTETHPFRRFCVTENVTTKPSTDKRLASFRRKKCHRP